MSRLRMFVAATAVATVAILTVATPASAHDELLGSTPAPGEALATAPETVTLHFSADVMTMGAVIVVADADGVDWVDGSPQVEGTTVTARVRAGLPDAGYELRWRVVSGDGHPIAGILPFTVGDAAPLTREPATDAAAPSASVGATAPDQTTQDGGILRVVLIGAGGAAVALALFALIRFLRRRGTRGGAGAQPSGSPPDSL